MFLVRVILKYSRKQQVTLDTTNYATAVSYSCDIKTALAYIVSQVGKMWI